MSDPLRSDRHAAPAEVQDRDRHARVEQLLLTGLDHYFAGQHELAISVWTRVLFLNHGHARAKAYIERARSAISERQREGDELLHGGIEAFARGDGAAARRLLTSAIDRGASLEEAGALIARLDRLETASAPRHGSIILREPGENRAGQPPAPEERPPSRLAWIATGALAGIAVAAAAVWLWLGGPDWLFADDARATPAAVRIEDQPLPVPGAAEVAFTRAMTLRDRGRLHEALDVLDSIRYGDPFRGRADELRAEIQRQLLAAAERPAPRPAPSPGAQGVPR